MDIENELRKKGNAAKAASYGLATLSAETKDKALLAMGEALVKRQGEILSANNEDMEAARQRGTKASYLDRLSLTKSRIEQMAEGIRQTAALPDPVWQGDFAQRRPNGLEIRRVRVPLGVVGIIYEARPNVTADAAALCLKSGNACLLRGGSEALRSNVAISAVMSEAATECGIPPHAIEYVDFTQREAVDIMAHMRGIIDVIIPRGGAGLIRRVTENSTVPVIETGTGVCHTFVDAGANPDMAIKIAVNAKTSRPSVCNAMETILVHEDIAPRFLPLLKKTMEEKKVELRGCEETRKILPDMKPATEEDWRTEYGDLILAVKVVKDLKEAITHINTYGTGHSETIVTENLANAHRFQQEVDAAAVYVNASTRFTDGFEFGFGAEIGISTQKLHARGPMGLLALTSSKYLIYGEGQVR